MKSICQKCGTGLDGEGYRYRWFEVEAPGGDEVIEGWLCADCVVSLEGWLEAR